MRAAGNLVRLSLEMCNDVPGRLEQYNSHRITFSAANSLCVLLAKPELLEILFAIFHFLCYFHHLVKLWKK